MRTRKKLRLLIGRLHLKHVEAFFPFLFPSTLCDGLQMPHHGFFSEPSLFAVAEQHSEIQQPGQ